MRKFSVTRARQILAACQGAYYVASGLWPLVSLGTFELVTGPKTDDWLARTVGMLAVVIGVTLFVASRRRTMAGEIALLGAASATAFASSDIVSVLTAGVSRVYLADAVVEVLLVAAWLALWRKGGRQAA